jgi:hypothetical protein
MSPPVSRLPRVYDLPPLRVRVRTMQMKSEPPQVFRAKLAEVPVRLKPAGQEPIPEIVEELRRSLKPADELLAVFTGLPPEGAADYALGPGNTLELKLLKPVAPEECTHTAALVERDRLRTLVFPEGGEDGHRRR